MNNCLFCKILNNEIPSYKIYENEYVIAILDISLDVDGHTLVIPKKHYVNILDCDNKVLEEVMKAVKYISNHYVDKLGYDGINILNNNNEAGEQGIPHFHVHIFPRKKNDGLNIFPSIKSSKMTLEKAYNFFKIK